MTMSESRRGKKERKGISEKKRRSLVQRESSFWGVWQSGYRASLVNLLSCSNLLRFVKTTDTEEI